MKLFIDTETTGVHHFNQPVSFAGQPHLVQLAALLHDDNRQVRAALNLIIKPDGWEIPTEAAAIHGITTEIAHQYGVPMSVSLEAFDGLLKAANLVVAHNTSFDIPVMTTQFFRAGQDSPFVGKQMYCTMKESTDILKIPGPYGYKWPKLDEAHQYFTGESFERAHDAMNDVLACSRVYYHLIDAAVVA